MKNRYRGRTRNKKWEDDKFNLTRPYEGPSGSSCQSLPISGPHASSKDREAHIYCFLFSKEKEEEKKGLSSEC